MFAPHVTSSHLHSFGPVSNKLGLSLPNIAPDIELYPTSLPPPSNVVTNINSGVDMNPRVSNVVPSSSVAAVPTEEGPKKKKYAKEAWPGKHPGQHLLI